MCACCSVRCMLNACARKPIDFKSSHFVSSMCEHNHSQNSFVCNLSIRNGETALRNNRTRSFCSIIACIYSAYPPQSKYFISHSGYSTSKEIPKWSNGLYIPTRMKNTKHIQCVASHFAFFLPIYHCFVCFPPYSLTKQTTRNDIWNISDYVVHLLPWIFLYTVRLAECMGDPKILKSSEQDLPRGEFVGKIIFVIFIFFHQFCESWLGFNSKFSE